MLYSNCFTALLHSTPLVLDKFSCNLDAKVPKSDELTYGKCEDHHQPEHDGDFVQRVHCFRCLSQHCRQRRHQVRHHCVVNTRYRSLYGDDSHETRRSIQTWQSRVLHNVCTHYNNMFLNCMIYACHLLLAVLVPVLAMFQQRISDIAVDLGILGILSVDHYSLRTS